MWKNFDKHSFSLLSPNTTQYLGPWRIVSFWHIIEHRNNVCIIIVMKIVSCSQNTSSGMKLRPELNRRKVWQKAACNGGRRHWLIIPASTWKFFFWKSFLSLTLCLHLRSHLWSNTLAAPASCCHRSWMCDNDVVRWETQITPPTLSLRSDTATGAFGSTNNIVKLLPSQKLETEPCWVTQWASPSLLLTYFRGHWVSQSGTWLQQSLRNASLKYLGTNEPWLKLRSKSIRHHLSFLSFCRLLKVKFHTRQYGLSRFSPFTRCSDWKSKWLLLTSDCSMVRRNGRRGFQG